MIEPSGQILQAAAHGDLDVVIAHAPSLETRYLVAPGHAALRCTFVASRFGIVGPPPPDDAAGVSQATSAVDAFHRIAARRATFVSRGDSSGTHVKELAIWKAAGVTPHGPWYIESGADQGTTLHIADERNGYALADLPTFAKLTGVRLRMLYAGDTLLQNPYTLYVVRRTPPRPGAVAFARWAIGPWRAALLARRLPDGQAAFTSDSAACSATASSP